LVRKRDFAEEVFQFLLFFVFKKEADVFFPKWQKIGFVEREMKKFNRRFCGRY